MDYVLFGMGYGATLMLLGWALRTYGPERKYKSIDNNDSNQVYEQRNWVRFVQGLGGVIAICGSALVLLTFIIMLINPDDTTGGLTSVIVWGFLLVVVLSWCWLYFTQYGMQGIWSPTTGYGFGSNPSSRLSGKAASMRPQSRYRPEVAAESPVVVDRPNEPEADLEPVDGDLLLSDEIENVDDSTDTAPEPEIDGAVEPVDDLEKDAGDQAEYDFGDGSDTTVPTDSAGRSEAIRRLRERQARVYRNQN